MKLFSSLEYFDTALGAVSDMFQSDYIQIENVRKVYFKDNEKKKNS